MLKNLDRMINSKTEVTWATSAQWFCKACLLRDASFITCQEMLSLFLGAFAEMRKMTSLSHVCPFVSIEQLGSNWKNFREIWYLSTFRKSAEKIPASFKSVENNGYFT